MRTLNKFWLKLLDAVPIIWGTLMCLIITLLLAMGILFATELFLKMVGVIG